jgi:hypothetical protein
MSNFFAGVCFGVAGMALLVLLDGIARKLIARARRRHTKQHRGPARLQTVREMQGITNLRKEAR